MLPFVCFAFVCCLCSCLWGPCPCARLGRFRRARAWTCSHDAHLLLAATRYFSPLTRSRQPFCRVGGACPLVSTAIPPAFDSRCGALDCLDRPWVVPSIDLRSARPSAINRHRLLIAFNSHDSHRSERVDSNTHTQPAPATPRSSMAATERRSPRPTGGFDGTRIRPRRPTAAAGVDDADIRGGPSVEGPSPPPPAVAVAGAGAAGGCGRASRCQRRLRLRVGRPLLVGSLACALLLAAGVLSVAGVGPLRSPPTGRGAPAPAASAVSAAFLCPSTPRARRRRGGGLTAVPAAAGAARSSTLPPAGGGGGSGGANMTSATAPRPAAAGCAEGVAAPALLDLAGFRAGLDETYRLKRKSAAAGSDRKPWGYWKDISQIKASVGGWVDGFGFRIVMYGTRIWFYV